MVGEREGEDIKIIKVESDIAEESEIARERRIVGERERELGRLTKDRGGRQMMEPRSNAQCMFLGDWHGTEMSRLTTGPVGWSDRILYR